MHAWKQFKVLVRNVILKSRKIQFLYILFCAFPCSGQFNLEIISYTLYVFAKVSFFTVRCSIVSLYCSTFVVNSCEIFSTLKTQYITVQKSNNLTDLNKMFETETSREYFDTFIPFFPKSFLLFRIQ
jgi:hypothetical protein